MPGMRLYLLCTNVAQAGFEQVQLDKIKEPNES